MQQLQNIQKMTGIGIPALASFLGVSRQAIAKAENGVCSLSIVNLSKISRLQACLDKACLADNEKQPAAISAADENRAMECRYFAIVLQKRLKSYESAYAKLTRLREALGQLKSEDEAEALWIQKTKNTINKKLDKCGIATCMGLRKRIYLLHAEADYIGSPVNGQNILP